MPEETVEDWKGGTVSQCRNTKELPMVNRVQTIHNVRHLTVLILVFIKLIHGLKVSIKNSVTFVHNHSEYNTCFDYCYNPVNTYLKRMAFNFEL